MRTTAGLVRVLQDSPLTAIIEREVAMRSIFRFASLTVVLAVAPLASPAWAQSYPPDRNSGQVDVSIFYDGLSSDGDWVEMPDYGWSFAPRVDRDWRPYTRGQWIWTDDGWYWDSDEDFGWATYHYGRWVNDRYYGWVWVPGTEWAPAWVSWRHGNGYTGWAPLPPRARWQSRVGLSIGGLEIDAYLGARDYSFVPDRSFVDRGLYQQVVPPAQNLTIINQTTNITNYTVVNQRVVNGGIPLASIEQAVGRSVPRSHTVEVSRADAQRRPSAGEVPVYRPSVAQAPARRPAQGRSLVKGEAAPPLLVERRKQKDQERQQGGNQPEPTARDAAQQRPQGQGAAQRPAPAAPAARRDAVAPPPQNQQPHARPVPTQPPVPAPQAPHADQRNREQPPTHDQAAPAQQPRAQPQPREQPHQAQQPHPAQQPQQPQHDQAPPGQQQKAQSQPHEQPQANPPHGKPEAPQTERPAKAAPPPPAKGNPNDKGNKKNPKPTPTPAGQQP